MEKINPKGQLSGSIGRFVFVNIGDITVVRTEPHQTNSSYRKISELFWKYQPPG
ncbi:hypothetical protein [Epilithonimonas vandammei]|uniref:hypothetical protein n=1 Tax=Epilithonimonas vandammei TaxID=2487072 RepID=UPI0028A805EC|nr:hypothetical protein [Epilithonimonas vandammei]